MTPRQHSVRALTVVALMIGLGLFCTGVAAEDGPRFSLQPATSDPTIPASRSYFILNSQPGQIVQAGVRVQNTGSTVGSVRLYPVDGATGQTSGAVYRSEADPRQDVGAWIAIDTKELTLKPAESQVIPFTVTVPASPRPGTHLGGIVAEDTAAKTNTPLGGASVTIKTVTVTAVQVTLPGPLVEKVSVTGVTPGGQSGVQTLAIGLHNEGTTMVAPTGTLTITNAQQQAVQNILLKLSSLLPDTAINYPVTLQTPALGAGTYDASVVLTYGQGGEAHATTHFTITPAQIQDVFPPTEPAQSVASATTVAAQPPVITGGAAQGGQPAASLRVPESAGSIPWLLILGAGLGGMLLMGLVGGAFMLGRRR